VHTESQGLENTEDAKRSLAAGDALSATSVTQHGEPVGTHSPTEFLRAALVALGRDGEPTRELVQEIERLVRHALRVLGDGGMSSGTPRRGKGI
jgi:isopentenyl diphosphate isomerase/L-lactate dehydrogenase-like FMN-dependent dehydrogenase